MFSAVYNTLGEALGDAPIKNSVLLAVSVVSYLDSSCVHL